MLQMLLLRILNRLKLLKYVNFVVPRVYNGRRIKVPVINNIGLMNIYLTELWMCSLLEKLLPLKKGVFIDVGVNVGPTLIKLRCVNKEIPYIGFEPNPSCVFYTQQLIKLNSFSNSRLVPGALFDKDGIWELNLFHEERATDDTASLIGEFRPDEKIERKIFVPVFNFESVNNTLNIEQISIIKIDVEGAELEVLKSLSNTIQKHQPILMMEILPCHNEKNIFRIERQAEIEKELKYLNYSIIRVLKIGSDKIEKLTRIKTIGIHNNSNWCEYLLVPSELLEQVSNLNFSK